MLAGLRGRTSAPCHDTIRANLLYARHTATELELIEACEAQIRFPPRSGTLVARAAEPV
ncbi:MAG: hypothetical protein ACRDNT_04610 [Streptosporangiaceae bacterium]